MQRIEFKCAIIAPEIHLQNIATHFGIKRKFNWDDTLVLRSNHLKGIIREPGDKYVFIFAFGGIVFTNFQQHEKMDVIKYLQKLDKSITSNLRDYFDEYFLEVDAELVEEEINFTHMRVRKLLPFQNEVIATVLAKSCALERTESAIDLLLDQTEHVVVNLRNGKLGTKDSELARMAANVLGFKLDTVSFVAILDKPEITWNNEAAGDLFDGLRKLFELEERYQKVQYKLEALKDVTDVFTAMTHAKRGNRLEWAVILLIAAEVALGIFDKVLGHFGH